jgi:hypothetical protein
MRNSTIKQQTGTCPMCTDGKDKPLIAGLCNNHYWFTRAQKSAEKQTKKEVKKVPGLNDLIDDADAVFSKFVRLGAVIEGDFLNCFICGIPIRWQEAQAMHYIKRGNLYLRWDVRNVKPGCEECNVFKDGNYVEYTRRLEEEHPGITAILQEESNLIYKPTRDEIRGIIAEYSTKFSKLKAA